MKRLASLLLLAGSALFGQQSAYNVDPRSLAFGNQTLDTASPSQRFVVSTPLFVPPPPGTIGQQFPNIDFTISSTNPAFTPSPTTFSIPANSGQSRIVNVTFRPTALGDGSGVIRVAASVQGDPFSTTDVTVSGTGIARFTMQPTVLHFGDVLLGCSSSHNISITTNTLLEFDVASTNPDFTASPTAFRTLSQTVTATFTPVRLVPTSSVYTVTASRGSAVAQTTRVQADGSGVDLGLSLTSLDFGAVPVGVASAPRTLAFTLSPGGVPVNFNAAATSSDGAFRATVSGVNASVTFTPPTEGPFAGTITFSIGRTDRGYSPCTLTRTLAVRGAGTTLNLTADPRSLDFGRVILGTTSAARTTTITNSTVFNFTGTAAVDNPAFTLTPTTFSLNAGRSQAFSLTFRPPAEGPLSTALNIVLTSSGGTAGTFRANVTVGLSAEGITPASVTVSPATLDFGDVSVGSSAIRSLTVSNNGGVSSAVTASTSNPAFSASPGSFTLAAGASQMVNLTFTPGATGPFQSTATFAITGSSRAVALAGRGVAPNFTYQQVPPGQTPEPIDPGDAISFATTRVGATSDFVQFEIRNTGTGSATINAIAPPSGAFVLDGVPPLPAVVGPGGNLTFRIAFRPTNPGSNTGSLTIDDRSFNLSGNAVLGGATFTGAGVTLAPATQPAIGLTLPESYTVPLTGTFTLTYVANAAGAPNEPAVQFASGGRTVSFTVPAGSTTALFGTAPQIAFQSGTVAGTITVRATLLAGGIDVTPTPTPTRTFTIPRAGPVIRSVTIANRTATSFQAVIVAYAVTREVNTLNFTFTASGTGTLQTTSLPIDVATRFGDWYRSPDAAPHGGAFTITVPFTVQGDLAAVRSLSVTLNNGDGASPAMSVNF